MSESRRLTIGDCISVKRSYPLKINREFILSDSRTERYQYKDRLKKAIERWGHTIEGFEVIVSDILSTYMNR